MLLGAFLTVLTITGGALAAALPSPVNIKLGTAIVKSATTTTSSAVPWATAAYDGSYQNTVLKHHNVHRANHSAPALQWGTLMAQYAMTWAQECKFAHNT